MTPDLINAVFEGLGGVVLLLNVRRVLRDKQVRGVDWRVLAFFAMWGLWNLYYYPHLDQWFSFAAGIGLVTVNIIYLYLLVYYTLREKRHAS